MNLPLLLLVAALSPVSAQFGSFSGLSKDMESAAKSAMEQAKKAEEEKQKALAAAAAAQTGQKCAAYVSEFRAKIAPFNLHGDVVKLFHDRSDLAAAKAGCRRLGPSSFDCAQAKPDWESVLKTQLAIEQDLATHCRRFEGLQPFAWYKKKLADQEPRVKAVGDDAYRLEPQRGNFKAAVEGTFDVTKVWSYYHREFDKTETYLSAAAREASVTASLKTAFRAVAAGVLTELNRAPAQIHDGFEAETKAKQAALAAKESCQGRCDESWRAALATATTELNALKGQVSSLYTATAAFRLKCDQLKSMILGIKPETAKAPLYAEIVSILGAFNQQSLEALKARYDVLYPKAVAARNATPR